MEAVIRKWGNSPALRINATVRKGTVPEAVVLEVRARIKALLVIK